MTKILLVEDNEMNRDMLSRRLIRKGYAVEIAVDGMEAIEKAECVVPDLILMDMSLPQLDGLEAMKRIRSEAALEHIPVIVLTANATVDDRANALAAGCDEFETKPIDMPQLLAKMEACLAARQSADSNA